MIRSQRKFFPIILLIAASSLVSCGDDDIRTYYLGFSPFPHVTTQDAVNYVYDRIAADGDMVAHHLGAYGVPWPEARAGVFPYNAHLMAEWESRRSRTRPDQTVYVALNPINQSRDGLANLWDGAGSGRPLPPPWNAYALNDPDVKIAYLNYARRAVEYFAPDFLTIGIEVNPLIDNNPALWDQYLDLHKAVYLSLKALYPNLPVMVSLTANDLLGYVDANPANQNRARRDIEPYSDFFCLSMYLYIGVNSNGMFPADAFDRLAAMASKPMAVCEAGYPSQSFELRSPGRSVQSSPNSQKTFIDRLFEAADKHDYRFIVHFFVRDLDESLDVNDIVRTFRYDGLYDVGGGAKPALSVWREKLNLSVRPPGLTETKLRWDGYVPDQVTREWRPQLDESASNRTSAAATAAEKPAFAFVYTNNNDVSTNTVSGFVISEAGTLTAIEGSPFSTGGTGSGIWRGVSNDIVTTQRGYVYAANQSTGDISGFSIDTATGQLSAVLGAPFKVRGWSGGDITLAVDPSGRLLVAGNSAAPAQQNIAAFAVGLDGTLTEQRTFSAGGQPVAIKISPDGKFVAVTLANDGRIALLAIRADGALTPVPGSPFFGQLVNATSVDFSCAGGFVYAANGAVRSHTNTNIDIFRMNRTGALEQAAGGPFESDAGVNGSVLLLNPDNTLLFVAYQGIGTEVGDAVGVFGVARESLMPVAEAPFRVGSHAIPAGLTMTQSGRLLLTANYSATHHVPSSIGIFAVGAQGSLTPAAGSPVPVPGSSLASIAVFPPAACGTSAQELVMTEAPFLERTPR